MRLYTLSLLYFAFPALSLVTTQLSNGFNNYSYSTGVTRHFLLNISSGIVEPDGFPRYGILVNGTTPGPTLHVEEGDEVEITVLNTAGRNISIHWHGIEQYGTPWSDGTVGITQFAQKTNTEFLYKWKATQHGLHWYHAHSRALLIDGLQGAIVIKPRPGRPNPFALIGGGLLVDALAEAEAKSATLMIGDWGHLFSEDVITQWGDTLIEPLCMQSMPINGNGQVICPSNETLASYNTSPRNASGPLTAQGCVSPYNKVVQSFPDTHPENVSSTAWYDCKNTTTPLEVVNVDVADEWFSIHIVNSGANWETVISIDEHPLWVYAADSSYIEPQKVDAISIPMGERYSAFIKLDKLPGTSFTIRTAANVLPQVISGYAILHYSDLLERPKVFTSPVESKPYIGYGSELLHPSYTLFNATYHPPYPAYPPPSNTNADLTMKLDLARENALVYVLNSEPFGMWREASVPPLFDPTETINANLTIAYQSGDVVDIIMVAAVGQPPHPIHKHGVKGWVIGSGTGLFPWSSVEEAIAVAPQSFNLKNPIYRDNFNTPVATAAPSWAVVRFVSQDPGPVLIHCHIALHLASGMGIVLLESMEDLPEIPSQYLNYAVQASGMRFKGQVISSSNSTATTGRRGARNVRSGPSHGRSHRYGAPHWHNDSL